MSQDTSYAPNLLSVLSWIDRLMDEENNLVSNSHNQNAIANDGNQNLAVQGGAVVQANVDQNAGDDENDYIDFERVLVDENQNASINDNNLELDRDPEQVALDERMYQEVVVSVREMMESAVRRRWLNEVVAKTKMCSIFQQAKNERWSVEYANQVCMDYIDLESNQVNRSLLSSRRPSTKKQRIGTETDSDDDDTEPHSNDDDSLGSPKLGGASYESGSFDISIAVLDGRLYQEVVVSVREMMGCAVRRRWLNQEAAELEMRSILQRAKNERWSVEYANQVCMDYIDLNSNQVNRSLLSSRRPSTKKQRIKTETDSDDDKTESHSEDDETESHSDDEIESFTDDGDSLDSPKLEDDDDVFDEPSNESDSFNSSGAAPLDGQFDIQLNQEVVRSFREIIGLAVSHGWVDETDAEWDMFVMFEQSRRENWTVAHGDRVAMTYINDYFKKAEMGVAKVIKREDDEEVHVKVENKREDDEEVHVKVENKRAHDYDEDDEQPKKRAKF